MKCGVLACLICIALILSGCATKGTAPETIPTPTEEPQLLGSGMEIPVSHGPLGRNHRAVRQVKDVFSTAGALKNIEHDGLTASELQAITRKLNYSSVLVSGCDLEVLKVFVASDWAPVVVTRSPVGPKHAQAIVGYDDSSGRIILTSPVNYAEAVFEYSEFSKQWDDPQNACLLIFAQRVIEEEITTVLKRYLPEEKVKSIAVRVPAKR